MKFFIPGKTFLVGEYSVLLGGAALGLATRPYFELTYSEGGEVTHFHPGSPAGLYLAKHQAHVSVAINDQYEIQGARGGFGKSTAEYFAAVIPDLLKNKPNFFNILAEYKSLHSGSGIDLAFQYFGQVTLADPTLNFYQNFDWNFPNLDFLIVSTGLKVPTHEHLSKLDLDSLTELVPISNKITNIYAENKEDDFIYHMNLWCEMLNANHLTHLNSVHLKMFLEKKDEIRLVKPCGALGADVVLVFFDKQHEDTVRSYIAQAKLLVQAHSHNLSMGVSTQLKYHGSENVG